MGSINIEFIQQDKTTQSEYLYSDLYLDLTNDYKIKGNFGRDETQLIDIKISYDIEAIKNSLNSIMSTYPGQRLLVPEFGINISRFLFAPVSDGNAYAIGEFITEGIRKWEPRVVVRELQITPKINDHQYDISLDFYVPSLKTDANFTGTVVGESGFTRG